MTESLLEELAEEQLSTAELRALLVRIGQAEFGGSDTPTVGALAEATGKTPAEVGRLLAELRGGTFHERFANVLQDHEGRLAAIEKKLPGVKPSQVKDFSYDAENFKLKPESKPINARDVALALLGTAILMLLAWFVSRAD